MGHDVRQWVLFREVVTVCCFFCVGCERSMASVAGTSIAMQDGVITFAQTITCHAWNGDYSSLCFDIFFICSFCETDLIEIAFCPNNNTVSIYRKNGNEWEIEDVLQEHDQTVTSISWSAKSDTLLTCSHDRNAYVWSFQEGQWKPTLVILRINRAATQVKWSPNGNLLRSCLFFLHI